MGREVRRVPPMWEHPRNPNGGYIPLFGRNIEKKIQEWEEGSIKWEEGFYEDWHNETWVPRSQSEIASECKSYTDWAGPRPDPKSYFPAWKPGEASWYAYYENTTEGTPLTPAFPTKSLLAKWLEQHGDTAGGEGSYEEWMSIL